jgi:hypothetical protein
VFDGVQAIFGFGTVTRNVVVVGSAGSLHFVNRFQDVLVSFIEKRSSNNHPIDSQGLAALWSH